MSQMGKENVQCIRAKTLPVVVTMPRSDGRAAKVVVMRPQCERRPAAVLEMPSPSLHAERIPILEMNVPDQTEAPSPEQPENCMAFYDGILMAVCAMLGWPNPGHGNDSGASAARPWKVEHLDVVSRVHCPMAAAA